MKRDEAMTLGARLQRLFSGAYSPHDGSDLFILPGAPREAAADAMAGLAGAPDPAAFVPMSLDRQLGTVEGVGVFGYEGELDEDEELVIAGTLPLALVGYAASAYVPLTGPTVIEVSDADDYTFFLEDADAAVADGRFPDQLTHPVVSLGDVCGLAADLEICGGRRGQRRFVGADGELRPSLHGAARRGGASCGCLPAEIADATMAEAAAARPWLARYLVVLDALRALRRREQVSVSVSGFGERLAASAAAEPIEEPQSLVILRDDSGEFTVVDPVDWRVFRVGRGTAVVLDALATCAAPDALDAVAASLAVSTTQARDVVERVRTQLPGRGLAVLTAV